jgi:hypothetical protein
VVVALLLALLPAASCGGGPEYRVFALKEGIGHFSMQYPPAYAVTRIDIRNDPSQRYSDVGLNVEGIPGLKEIDIYAWPAGDAGATAVLILDGVLARAGGVFRDFKLLERDSMMVGDIDGQVARFAWTALPAGSTNMTQAGALPAVSRVVCFRHGDVAWEIHVASDNAGQAAAGDEFQNIIENFQVLD